MISKLLSRMALALALFLLSGMAAADTTISLFKSFAGNVNFVGTQKTLRTQPNSGNACAVNTGTTSAVLSGIPTGAKVLSAQLYWAGSGSTAAADYSVTFEGAAVTAPTSRQYNVRYSSGSTNFDFFSGAVDVTTQVTSKRNGTYSFTGLTVNTGSPYCASEAVLGGWSLAVVYSYPSETFRVLNIYEGFQSMKDSSVSLTLSNFNIPPLTSGQTGRVAHITWEGDDTLGGGEDLKFNGVSMTDSMNPVGYQFNSASNINNDSASYGVDFDAYTLSSPVIKAGDTSYKTVYSSGPDLVLLSAEIISVPNTPTADIAVTVSLDQTLSLGQTAIYSLTASNNGPGADPGPFTVTSVLPANLSVVQVGGDDWACTVSGQTVTCKYTQLLDTGAVAPPINLMVMVDSGTPGDVITNNVSVTGTLFDNVSGNNAVAYPSTLVATTYVFTDGICTRAVAFGSSQPCKFIKLGNRIGGETIDKIYITLLNAKGVPTPASTLALTTLSFRFAMSCQDPTTANGSVGTFPSTSVTMPTCASNGATPSSWTAYQLFIVPANSPTIAVSMNLVYPDTGKIKLFMSDSNSKTGASGPIVMKPLTFLMNAYRPASATNTTKFPNPATTPAIITRGNDKVAVGNPADRAFLRVGELFTTEVVATIVDGVTPAKNYGREINPRSILLNQTAPVDSAGKDLADLKNNPTLKGNLGDISNGAASGSNYAWDEVGLLTLTAIMPISDDNPRAGDFMSAGPVSGTPANVGRFYPDHFDTTTTQIMPCPSRLTCPATVSGAVYAGQPFPVSVTARHGNGAALQNYQGAFARDVTLQAWDAVGSIVQLNPPAAPAGNALNTAALAATAFDTGVGIATPNYAVGNDYDNSDPHAAKWTGPAAQKWTGPIAIYLRASNTEGKDAGNNDIIVTSRRVVTSGSATSTSTTVEGGQMILNGRMLLSNAYGSELLPLPVSALAQYYDGTTWVLSDSDSVSAYTPTSITYSSCTKKVGSTTATATCSDLLNMATSGTLTLKNGLSGFRLAKSVTGISGSGSLTLNLNNPSWLPSTTSRVTFGVYKSGPVTYVRETFW